MISQIKTLKIKSFPPFNFVTTKSCVAIHLAENGTKMGGMCFDYPLVFTLGNVLPAEKAFIGQSTDIFGNLNDVNVFPKSLKLPTDSFRLILKKHFLQSSF